MLRQSVSGRKSTRNAGLLFAVSCVMVFSFVSLASAQTAPEQDDHDSHARIVRISYVEGQVLLDNGRGYESVTMNVPVTERNWLQTRSDGWAEIQMEDGSLVRLAPDTVIAFTALGRSTSGGTLTTVDLDQGEAEFKVLKHDGNEFQITVKNKTIVLKSPGSFRVTSTNDDPMEVAVRKGEVSVHDPESGEDVAVKKNETFVLNPADPAQYALDQGTEADELDQWSSQRDDSLRAYAANNRTQSPYQYGTSDLNYYGQYTDDPQYGNVWQPYGISMDWDPFSNGYWASSSAGGIWVSSYPWGWMPYRYGRWVFINGRGWFWQPGGWSNWNNGPHIANAPPGFHPPALPAIIVNRTPRPGLPAGNIGSGHGITGPAGRTFSSNNENLDNPGPVSQRIRNKSVHVFTNDEVQTTPPHQETVKTGSGAIDGVVNADGRSKTVQRQRSDGTGVQERTADRVQGDRQTRRQQAGGSNQEAGTSQTRTRESVQERPAPAPVREPPVREQRAPAQVPVVRQQAAPTQPVVHQSAPPSAPMRSQSSGSGGGSASHSSSSATSSGSRSQSK
jgi:FecR protein